jgi:UDP-N-acetylglucosamine:LPS N-acetylglucosamine transferase
MKLLLVSSVGGHLTEVMQTAEVFAGKEVVLVVDDRVDLPAYPFSRVYRIAHGERDWRVALNFVEAARILEYEDPDVILSTGAGVVVPFAMLGRWLQGARVVYVESAAAITRPTLTGRLMYPIAHDFFYQWASLARFFPKGRLAPIVFG